MMFIEVLLLLCFALLPAIELIDSGNTKQRITTGKITKVRAYQETILLLVVPTSLLFTLMALGDVSAHELGLVIDFNVSQCIAFLGVVVIVGYLLISFRRVVHNERELAKIAKQLNGFHYLLPSNVNEARWFIGGVSVCAGVCEELLFRGYLLHAFVEYIGLPLSVVVSSALFGLCHAYQGWNNVLRTALVGAVLSIIYLLSGSLFVVIILHFLQDAYVGLLYFITQREQADNCCSSYSSR